MASIQRLCLLWLGIISFHKASCESEACATTDVDIRSNPGTWSANKGLLKKGQCLPYGGDNVDGTWVEVLYDREASWIYKEYVCIKDNDADYFGDLMILQPTGAGNITSRDLDVTGVEASHRTVDEDIDELTARKCCYIIAGMKNGIHPAVIAAIASRETRGGRMLYGSHGYGDNRRSYGIMQCDLFASGLGDECEKYDWDSCEHINHMTSTILFAYINQVQKKHPTWTPEQQLQGGVAAYNIGLSNVRTWAHLDMGSTGNDYSNDVIARAQHLIRAYGW